MLVQNPGQLWGGGGQLIVYDMRSYPAYTLANRIFGMVYKGTNIFGTASTNSSGTQTV